MSSQYPLLDVDPWLKPYAQQYKTQQRSIKKMKERLLDGMTVDELALGHLYYGLHKTKDGWVLREWAPNATAIYLVGDHSEWKDNDWYAFEEREYGVWELQLDEKVLRHGDNYKLHLYWHGGNGYRLSAYTRYAVQDEDTKVFSAQVWQPKKAFQWTDSDFAPASDSPLIYEAHVGMSSEQPEVATYKYFTKHILKRIKKAGYNTVQLMAIAEHPYYGSFGYHVSNFFAPSSRFGTPDDLKKLVDTAHSLGLRVIMDIVHSHSVRNEEEGLSRFDGTLTQYFHDGDRGHHRQWDSRVFDYAKPEVTHFLLSNLRYWLDEFHFDGFRFDGVTSMLYSHHGLEKAFTGYDDYFNDEVEVEALTYLSLANELIHTVKPGAITIAEDMSALPGLAYPTEKGGLGFDYRMSMGVPDLWIKTLKEKQDEEWPLGHLLYELTARRAEEKVISYAESHDQALVGDKTLIFRLLDKAMYEYMMVEDTNLEVERGIALRKMIYLLTAATHGGGYLAFMGNEFGHPEWIDFPRQGNDWSYHHARRQWNLADDKTLKYHWLNMFDTDMLEVIKQLDDEPISYTYINEDDRILAFMRGAYLFAFNFSPTISHQSYIVPAKNGEYGLVLSSDDTTYGGNQRVEPANYSASKDQAVLYLPTRTAIVLKKLT